MKEYNSNFNYEFLKSLPKAEIHCHLDGSMRVETILELAKEREVSLPYNTYDELAAYLQVGNDCNDLPDYLKAFDTTVSVLQDTQAIIRSVVELAEDCTKENIRVIEVRYCPSLSTQQGMNNDDVVRAMIEAKKQVEAQYNITINFILCALRHRPIDEAFEILALAITYRFQGVVAFDLAGPEAGFPATDFISVFKKAMTHNVNITIHAGEAYGPESIHQSVHYAGARRIGHGTSLIQDQLLMDFVNDHRIAVECCLSCNVQTKAVKSIETHPFKEYLKKGLRVTINTDNRLISHTTLSEEYLLACNAYNIDASGLKALILNGFKSLFIPFQEKQILIKNIKKELKEISQVFE